MPLDIDMENLETLERVIKEISQSMRIDLLQDKYERAEYERRYELLSSMRTALTWTVNYFDYYRIYEDSDPIQLLSEIDSTIQMVGGDGSDTEYFTRSGNLVKLLREQYDKDEGSYARPTPAPVAKNSSAPKASLAKAENLSISLNKSLYVTTLLPRGLAPVD